MADKEQLKTTLAKLREPFRPEEHSERKLKGGGNWLYVPWQYIRRRIETLAPDYEFSFTDPLYVGEYCTIRCSMTIEGITRTAIGNAEIELLSSTGKDMSRGTPIERAVADAYKNAAEAFGVGAYLDDQTADARKFAALHLNKKGDGRLVKEMMRSGEIPGNLTRPAAPAPTKPVTAKAPTTKSAPQATPDIAPQDPNCITREQQKRLFAIGSQSGYTKAGLKLMVKINGFDSSAAITRVIYKDICEAAGDPTQAAHWNAEAIGTWEQTA